MQGNRGHKPQIQRPMILDVLPAGIAPRLDVLLVPLRKRLARKFPRWMRHWWTAPAAAVLAAAVVLAVWQPWQAAKVQLPASITSRVSGFVPYFFAGSVPPGFTLDQKATTYSDGILFFRVEDPGGNGVVVSEQALPDEFASSTPQGSQTVNGIQGKATISDTDGRTIGTIITSKKPQALISLNSVNTVSNGAFEKLMQSLTPTK